MKTILEHQYKVLILCRNCMTEMISIKNSQYMCPRCKNTTSDAF